MPIRMFLLSLEFFVGAGSGDMGFSLKSVHDANFVGVTSHPITSVDSYFHPEEDGSHLGAPVMAMARELFREPLSPLL